MRRLGSANLPRGLWTTQQDREGEEINLFEMDPRTRIQVHGSLNKKMKRKNMNKINVCVLETNFWWNTELLRGLDKQTKKHTFVWNQLGRREDKTFLFLPTRSFYVTFTSRVNVNALIFPLSLTPTFTAVLHQFRILSPTFLLNSKLTIFAIKCKTLKDFASNGMTSRRTWTPPL